MLGQKVHMNGQKIMKLSLTDSNTNLLRTSLKSIAKPRQHHYVRNLLQPVSIPRVNTPEEIQLMSHQLLQDFMILLFQLQSLSIIPTRESIASGS